MVIILAFNRCFTMGLGIEQSQTIADVTCVLPDYRRLEKTQWTAWWGESEGLGKACQYWFHHACDWEFDGLFVFEKNLATFGFEEKHQFCMESVFGSKVKDIVES